MTFHRNGLRALEALALALAMGATMPAHAQDGKGLWSVYDNALKGAKYVDLTHTITPKIPVWAGFADPTFAPAKAGATIEGYVEKGTTYTYKTHGFEASDYHLPTDQLGTQLESAGPLGAGISGH